MNAPDRKCSACGETKPVREFYESCRAECIACKRQRSNRHKRAAGYNVAYRLRKAGA